MMRVKEMRVAPKCETSVAREDDTAIPIKKLLKKMPKHDALHLFGITSEMAA